MSKKYEVILAYGNKRVAELVYATSVAHAKAKVGLAIGEQVLSVKLA